MLKNEEIKMGLMTGTMPAQKPLVMTSDQVFGVIKEVARVSGNEKQTILKQRFDDPMLRAVLTATYDPFVTYGIKQIPVSTVAGNEDFTDHTFELLHKLATRELTGNAAKQAILSELNLLSDESVTLLTRILKKDLRAGFTAETCNRIEPGFIFVFKCMKAHKFEGKRIKQWPVAAEPKYDGVRSLAVWDGRKVTFYSLTGKVFEGMTPIADAIAEKFSLHDVSATVLDGELMDKSNEFNKIVGDVHKKDFAANDALYYVFDAISWEDFQADKELRDYRQRRMELSALAENTGMVTLKNVRVTPVRVLRNLKQIEKWAEEIMAQGGEGLIVKPLNGLYEKKRSYNWLKIKGEHSIDAVILATEGGTGKYEGKIGAVLIDYNGTQVRVGSGLTDDIRNLDPDELINRMIEVKYHEETPDGSLRHPRFTRFRDDKPVEDGHGV
jgi:DNA ligase-1